MVKVDSTLVNVLQGNKTHDLWGYLCYLTKIICIGAVFCKLIFNSRVRLLIHSK